MPAIMLLRSKNYLFALVTLFILNGCTDKQPDSLSGSRPNIVFILADDLGWADLPVYGNKFNEAPHLSQMADEGIRFTDAYAACPVCSPTRASIMSGQYPARVGIIDFISGHWRPFEEVIVPNNRQQFLPLEIYTMAEALKDAGYRTGYYGKWHLGGNKYYPEYQGFDEVNVIEKNRETPFFLFLAHFDVHVQLDADSMLIEKYLAKQKVDGYPCNAVYAAMVEHVDQSAGRIRDKLIELGISENTLVVFFSDNGGLISRFDRIPLLADSKLHIYEEDTLRYVASSNAPLRAEKGTIYEGGIREPMIMWWPGTLEPGEVNSAIISSVDFLPTFADLAGAELPDEQVFDGMSLVNLMEGSAPDPDRAIFWHYPVYHHDEPASVVRKGKWKLIHNLVSDRRSLYDLESDIGETTDLSNAEPEIANELNRLLEEWHNDCGAEFPVPNPGFDPERRYEWGRHPDRN
jgi:uncharacterized sulfatase